VRGMFVVARQAEQAIAGFESVSRFQLIVGRSAYRDVMTLKAELKGEAVDKKKLADDLGRRFQEVCRMKLDKIELVAKGTIPEKHQAIVDERSWE